MRCDCLVRPLWTWLSNQPDTTSWRKVICHQPPHLAGRSITSLDIDELTCKGRTFAATVFIKPDIKIRGSEVTKDRGLRVVWYVATREDVAGFKATLRNTNGSLVSEQVVPYNKREYVFRDLGPTEKYQLCFVAVDSLGSDRQSYKSQCDYVGPVGSGSSLNEWQISKLFTLFLCLCLSILSVISEM